MVLDISKIPRNKILLANPQALTHLPCSVCKKPAEEIGALEGTVTEKFEGSLRWIDSCTCGDCKPVIK